MKQSTVYYGIVKCKIFGINSRGFPMGPCCGPCLLLAGSVLGAPPICIGYIMEIWIPDQGSMLGPHGMDCRLSGPQAVFLLNESFWFCQMGRHAWAWKEVWGGFAHQVQMFFGLVVDHGFNWGMVCYC